jgi:hypothetical protein
VWHNRVLAVIHKVDASRVESCYKCFCWYHQCVPVKFGTVRVVKLPSTGTSSLMQYRFTSVGAGRTKMHRFCKMPYMSASCPCGKRCLPFISRNRSSRDRPSLYGLVLCWNVSNKFLRPRRCSGPGTFRFPCRSSHSSPPAQAHLSLSHLA